MKITKQTATGAAGWLKQYETPEAAAHQVSVQLTAIRPYSSRDLERIRGVLLFCASSNEDVKTRRIASLLEIANR